MAMSYDRLESRLEYMKELSAANNLEYLTVLEFRGKTQRSLEDGLITQQQYLLLIDEACSLRHTG